MENTNLPPQKPVLVDEPPTFEYVETKRNWIKYVEIGGAIVLICIPLILSFFKIDYSVKRVYELVNPAYIGTSPDNDAWSGIITAAKKIVQPVINVSTNNNATTEQPTSTPTPTSSSQPTEQSSQQTTEQQNQEQQNSAVETNDVEPQQEKFLWIFPITNNEPSKTPSEAPSPANSGEQTDTNTTTTTTNQNTSTSTTEKSTTTLTPEPIATPLSVCSGKHKNDKCSYTENGRKVDGRCQISSYGGKLICIPNYEGNY